MQSRSYSIASAPDHIPHRCDRANPWKFQFSAMVYQYAKVKLPLHINSLSDLNLRDFAI